MREETRRRLIEAGARALMAGGLDGVRTTAVARDAGVADGTFYLHFADREALVAAVAETALSELAASLRDIRDDGSDLAGTDHAAVEAIVACGERNRDIMIAAMNASLLNVGADPFGPLIEQRTRELEAARESGQFDPGSNVKVTAQAEFAALARTVSWWLLEDTGVSRAELVTSLVAITRRITHADPSPGGNNDGKPGDE